MTIKHKYGEFSDEQFAGFLNKVHDWVHMILIYAEEKSETTLPYIARTQNKLAGLNDLLNQNQHLVEILTLIESAKIEFEKHGCKTPHLRKMILNAHDLIDKLEPNV